MTSRSRAVPPRRATPRSAPQWCCRLQRRGRRAQRSCPPVELRGGGRRSARRLEVRQGDRRSRPRAARPRRRWPPDSGWPRRPRSHRAPRRGRGGRTSRRPRRREERIRTSSSRPSRSRYVARDYPVRSAAREVRPPSERRATCRPRAARAARTLPSACPRSAPAPCPRAARRRRHRARGV